MDEFKTQATHQFVNGRLEEINNPTLESRVTALEEEVEDMKFLMSAMLSYFTEPQMERLRKQIRETKNGRDSNESDTGRSSTRA